MEGCTCLYPVVFHPTSVLRTLFSPPMYRCRNHAFCRRSISLHNFGHLSIGIFLYHAFGYQASRLHRFFHPSKYIYHGLLFCCLSSFPNKCFHPAKGICRSHASFRFYRDLHIHFHLSMFTFLCHIVDHPSSSPHTEHRCYGYILLLH